MMETEIHWRHLTVDQRRAIIWKGTRHRLAEREHQRAHPRRLAAWWLFTAANCRKAAARDRHPGRDWWLRNARIDLAAAKAARNSSPLRIAL